MKQINALWVVFVMGMLLTTAASADDVADVKAAVRQHTGNTNTGKCGRLRGPTPTRTQCFWSDRYTAWEVLFD